MLPATRLRDADSLSPEHPRTAVVHSTRFLSGFRPSPVDNVHTARTVRHSRGMTAVESYRQQVPAHLRLSQLVDPARLLRDLALRMPLSTQSYVLCQVARPATEQRLVAHTVVWCGGAPTDQMRAIDETEEAMRRIGHRDFDRDDDERLTSAVVMVVIRSGRAVQRRADFDLWRALRYANNPFQVLIGDLLVVTPHGWIELGSGLAGLDPVASMSEP